MPIVDRKSTKLRKARMALGITLTEFADRVGVSKQSAALWERGTTAPKDVRYPQIAKVLGLSARP